MTQYNHKPQIIEPVKGQGVWSLYPSFFSKDSFDGIQSKTAWEVEQLRLFGREYVVPRMIAFYGEGVSYRYSGKDHHGLPFFPELEHLRHECEQLAQTKLNSALLNWYRSGSDSMGWHADDEPQLGDHPYIVSVSLGCRRRFCLKHKSSGLREEFDLGEGDVFIMSPPTQENWVHSIPKTKKKVGERINITFRMIDSDDRNNP